jgi:hypothetical protein
LHQPPTAKAFGYGLRGFVDSQTAADENELLLV